MDALRSVLPAGTLVGRAEGPRDADHRRARADQARRLRRRDRLPRATPATSTRAIHIRTVVIKDGRAHVQAGGGTVADAKPGLRVRRVRGEGARRAARGRARARSSPTGHDGVLVVDNYDSFTYNLVQYLGELGAELEVVRNDARDRRRAARARARPRRRLARARARPTRPASRRGRCAASPRPGSRRSASASATSRSRRRSAAASSATSRPRQDERDHARRPHDLRRAAGRR